MFECSEDFLANSSLQRLYLTRARKATLETKRRQETSFNRLHNTRDGRFVIGDRVLLFSPDVQSNKITKLFTGPFIITAIKDTNAYIVLANKLNSAPKVVHFERLSLCYPELPDFPSPRTLKQKSGEEEETEIKTIMDDPNGPEAAEKEKERASGSNATGTNVGGASADIQHIRVVNVKPNEELNASIEILHPVDLSTLGITSVPPEICHVATPGTYRGFPTVATPGYPTTTSLLSVNPPHDPIYTLPTTSMSSDSLPTETIKQQFKIMTISPEKSIASDWPRPPPAKKLNQSPSPPLCLLYNPGSPFPHSLSNSEDEDSDIEIVWSNVPEPVPEPDQARPSQRPTFVQFLDEFYANYPHLVPNESDEQLRTGLDISLQSRYARTFPKNPLWFLYCSGSVSQWYTSGFR